MTVESSPASVDGWHDVRINFHENSSFYLEIGVNVTVNLEFVHNLTKKKRINCIRQYF
jgi:hypothetical protein